MKKQISLTLVLLSLTFLGFSQIVITDPAVNITDVAAQCSGSVTAPTGVVVTSKGIVYSTSLNPSIPADISISMGTGNGSFSGTITGLTISTSYHIRAYATTAAGTVYGNDIVFTTISAALATTQASIKLLSDTKSSIDAFISKQKSSIFKFGLSIAVRTALNNGNEKQARAIATISPDSLVSIDYGDQLAVVISTTVAAYPFKIKKDENGNIIKGSQSKFLSNLGFLANVNLIEFANSNTTTIFNKQVDGGLGFSYLLGTREQFAVAITYERISVRQPTKYVFDHEGKKIIDNGTALTTLDLKDPRFYRDAGMNGMSVKFIFHFN